MPPPSDGQIIMFPFGRTIWALYLGMVIALVVLGLLLLLLLNCCCWYSLDVRSYVDKK